VDALEHPRSGHHVVVHGPLHREPVDERQQPAGRADRIGTDERAVGDGSELPT
jgi:hypothetical protein